MLPQSHSCPLGLTCPCEVQACFPRHVPAPCLTQAPRPTSAQPLSPHVQVTLTLHPHPRLLTASHIYMHTGTHAHTSTHTSLCTCCSPASSARHAPPSVPESRPCTELLPPPGCGLNQIRDPEPSTEPRPYRLNRCRLSGPTNTCSRRRTGRPRGIPQPAPSTGAQRRQATCSRSHGKSEARMLETGQAPHG